VVGPNTGLVGHYIRRYQLGIAVDPADPSALREAVLELSADSGSSERFAAGLKRFSEEMAGPGFASALRSCFGLGEDAQREERGTG
jgi:hypothetical protein